MSGRNLPRAPGQDGRFPVRVTWMDKAIAAVSPQSALRRIQARAAVDAIGSYGVARTAGGFRGSLSNWWVNRNSRWSEAYERETIADRAEDLAANDPHASSVIDSMAINTVGTGMTVQSRPNHRVLGWTEAQAQDFAAQAEWFWSVWCKEADAGGRLPFWAIELLSVHSMLVRGEFLRIPVMIDEPDRLCSLAIQCIDPLRMATPSDLVGDARIRDGVELGNRGEPLFYWVSNPPADGQSSSASMISADFARVPARLRHRPGAMHAFFAKREEQVRGVSVLAPAMKFFRDLSDYLDYELVGAIIAASFPVFIESGDPYGAVEGLNPVTPDSNEPRTRYAETPPGQILYGNIGEKPHVLKNERPGNSFPVFVERILRAIGASVGMPYEVVAKDFSKTNYSSARAALLEAWRVFKVYQKWLVDRLSQPCWEMVLEELWLRDMLQLPPGSPDWHDARHAYTRAVWVPPKRGHVDPEKEIGSFIKAKDHNLLTLAEIIAELAGGDWTDTLIQRGRERSMERAEDIVPPGQEEEIEPPLAAPPEEAIPGGGSSAEDQHAET